MDLAEELVKYLIADARKQCAEELELFAKFVDKELLARLDFVIERPFQRITYTEAVDLLKKSGEKFEFPIDYGSNLQSEHAGGAVGQFEMELARPRAAEKRRNGAAAPMKIFHGSAIAGTGRSPESLSAPCFSRILV